MFINCRWKTQGAVVLVFFSPITNANAVWLCYSTSATVLQQRLAWMWHYDFVCLWKQTGWINHDVHEACDLNNHSSINSYSTGVCEWSHDSDRCCKKAAATSARLSLFAAGVLLTSHAHSSIGVIECEIWLLGTPQSFGLRSILH